MTDFRGRTLIGLSGFARSGKDTAGAWLSELTGWQTYALASPIKNACNTLFGWDNRHSDGDLKEVVDEFWGVSPRHAYQTLGTEWGRELICDDIWLKRAERLYYHQGALIVTDVRFQNEADWIRSHPHGLLVHIKRPEVEGAVLSHASEAGLEVLEGDMVIENSTTLESFKESVECLYDIIK